MHPLPEFSYPAGSRVPSAILLCGGTLAWVLALALWWHAWGVARPPPAGWWLLLVSGGAWLAYAIWVLQRLPEGALHWCVDHPQEPGYWAWRGEVNGTVAARQSVLSGLEWALDLQWAVLLRLQHPAEAPRWVWCLETAEPARWGALRRSLQFTRQQPPAPG